MPPRTVQAELAFWAAIEEPASLEPAFASVTYGAGGSTREMTVAVVRRLARERGLEAMPYVTAAGAGRSQLDLLDAVVSGGADNVLVLRGDPPRDGTPPATSAEALALCEMAAELGLCVVGACSLEPHPDPRGWAADLAWLRRKIDAGVRAFITQLFFDVADYVRFVERADLGVPVIPRIIPIAGITQLERMLALCSATVPRRLRRELDARRRAARPCESRRERREPSRGVSV